MSRNIVIIGGIAGGMTAAARLRRLSEEDNITIIEKGEHISYANCGMPYYIGDVISQKERLFVKTPNEFSKLFNVTILTKTEALKINRENKTILVKNLNNNENITLPYDKLLIATGAEPYIPDTPGIKSNKIFKLRNIEDMDKIKELVDNSIKSALIVGGGFIGLELAENLRHKNIEVTIIELDKQVMASIDPEMAAFIHDTLDFNQVNLKLERKVVEFKSENNKIIAVLDDQTQITTDIAIISIGVMPDTILAQEAGLNTGIKNSIIVNDTMQTNDPDIFAVGDAVQIKHFIGGHETLIPLAGPANRQARVVANVLNGIDAHYKGTLGTSIVKIFDLTVASTGYNEKTLKRLEIPHLKTYIHPNDHAGYYPEACQISLKLLFSPDNGKLLGSQIIGYQGVDKRIDVIATAIKGNMTVYDLEDLELAYAPPFNSVKDPVNIAGNIAVNILRETVNTINPEEIDNLNPEKTIILDVSTPDEFKNKNLTNSINIPISELRSRLNELDPDKEIIVYCQLGLRGYLGYRILKENNFNVKNLSGGLKIYKAFHHETGKDESRLNLSCSNMLNPTDDKKKDPNDNPKNQMDIELNVCGLQCPGPILELNKKIGSMQNGEILNIQASDPGFYTDSQAWCNKTGNKLLSISKNKGKITATIQKTSSIKESQDNHKSETTSNKTDKTIVVFSNDLDKALAAFIIANGAASMGDKVTLFFTFWGLNVIRKNQYVKTHKNLIDRMFGFMMPRGSKKLSLSKMNMLGMGTEMMKYVMKNKNVLSLDELIELSKQNGIRLVACSMSMDVMGLKKEELLEGTEESGVAGFLESANHSNVNLFI